MTIHKKQGRAVIQNIRSQGQREIRSRNQRAPRRAGMALPMVLVFIAIAMMLGAILLKTVALQHRFARGIEQQNQAIWLADSGLQRALHRLATTPDYEGEEWRIPADVLGSGNSGLVTIHVEHIAGDVEGNSPDRKRVVVEAVYPDHPQYRVLERREYEMDGEP